MSRVLIAALLSWLVTFPAVAATTPRGEIIYRASLGRAADVKLLLTKGISPDEKSDDGVPLLALAAARKDKECLDVMKVLLDAGAHVNAADSGGQTALFYAIKQGDMNAVKYLLFNGADYYALDHSGETARDFAYITGHQDIGVAIDNFVREQSAERAEEYKKWQEIVAERSKPQEAPQAPTPPAPPPLPEQVHEFESPTVDMAKITKLSSLDSSTSQSAQPASEPTPTPASSPQPVEAPPPLTPQEKAAQEAAQIAAQAEAEKKQQEKLAAQAEAEKKRQEALKPLFSDLAFNNCAFQYWSFISDVGQSTALSSDELDDTVDSYRGKITAMDDQLTKDYSVGRKMIVDISNSAKQRIFNELHAMPSKSYRHEMGVGKEDDMQLRCHAIARHWDKEPPAPPQLPKSDGGKSNLMPYNGSKPGMTGPH